MPFAITCPYRLSGVPVVLAKFKTLLHFLQKDHPKGAAIVYVAFKNEAESVANYLKVQGVVARPYHAGLDKSERHRTQMQFQENKVRVIVATVAFGMGLDKPDVRYVINYALPRSPEAYIQQCGRAGRDGNEAHCLTFLDPEDYLRSRSLATRDSAMARAFEISWKLYFSAAATF